MILEDLQDQIKEKATELWSQIQESPTYNGLRERYETLPPATQRWIITSFVVVVALLLISFPYSYFRSSADAIGEFDNNRSLIRRLLHASRLATEVSSVPETITSADLKAKIQGDMGMFSLLPEQIAGVVDLPPNEIGSLAPSSIRQEGVGVRLKKLNLKQVLDIGLQLQSINPSVKMAGLDIVASSPDPHYFDVLFKLVIFSLPRVASAIDASDLDKGERGTKGSTKPDSDENKNKTDGDN